MTTMNTQEPKKKLITFCEEQNQKILLRDTEYQLERCQFLSKSIPI